MIIKENIIFTYQNKIRNLHIYLPDDYYDTNDYYPVMYFFDGHNLFHDEDATYGYSWGLEEFLNHWNKKMIIVGMECSHEGNERLIEYSPYHLSGKFWGNIDGIGYHTMRWIVDEIKPYIDNHYRVYTHREATGIGGSSMGGLMSLYAVTMFNDTFSKAACLSSAIRPCLNDLYKDISKQDLHPDTKIYLSWGDKEIRDKNITTSYMMRAHQKIISLLKEKNVQVVHYLMYNGKHNEDTWRKQNKAYLNYLWLEQGGNYEDISLYQI